MNTKFHDLIIINRPDKIYIPINKDKDYTIVPKIGEYIYKTSAIAHTKGEIKEEIFSPISGKYTEVTVDDNGKYIVIENDYKEMNEELRGINKNLDYITYDQFIQKLKESNIYDNNESIYTKYENSNKKTFLIDCFNNSYIYNKYVIENNLNELLEMIDAICSINKLASCIFIVNKKDKKLRKLLEQRIGTYLNFKIGLVKMKKQNEKINIINKKYKLNNQYILENIKNLIAMKNIFKYNMPYIEKYVILRDTKNSIPLKVKIGTKISYIFSSLKLNVTNFTLKTSDSDIEVNNQDIVIDSNINEIII